MSNSVTFNGLTYYPIGAAQIEIVDGNLLVSNISNSGLDGVAVRTEGANSWQTSLQDISIEEGQEFYISHIGVDSSGRTKTLNEQVVAFNLEKGKTAIAANSKLMSKKFKIIGKLNGEITFEKEYDNPTFDPDVNYIWLLYILLYILEHADYEYEVTTHPDGSQTTRELFSWNGSANQGGGEPIQTFDNQTFEADRIYIETEDNYPDGVPSDQTIDIQEVRMIGKGIGEFTILATE